eukprot:945029-Prymnesium_polylepis.1
MSSTTTSVIYDNKSQTNFKSRHRYILRKFDGHPDKLLPVATAGKLDALYRLSSAPPSTVTIRPPTLSPPARGN